MSRISWTIDSCALLCEVAAEFAETQPFSGLTIGTGIHLEPKTVTLLLTLVEGGARVVATGNLNTTQPDSVRYLQEHGVTVIGQHTTSAAESDANVADVLAQRPQLLLDNGGDLFTNYLSAPYAGLLGGTEETTTGRARLEPLREALRLPILVINDSPIKQFAENKHAVGQSVLESFMRITNHATNGRRVLVFGYGPCGKGIALNFRNAHALVSVVDTDQVLRLEAMLDGYDVPDRASALANADIIITATGAAHIVRATDIAHLRDGAILINAGHLPQEIDVDDIRSDGAITAVGGELDGIETLACDDGRRVHILAGGHMVNLAGPRPLGNSIDSMDAGFALQARCLEAVARGQVDADSCVVPVPKEIDAAVAEAFIRLHRR